MIRFWLMAAILTAFVLSAATAQTPPEGAKRPARKPSAPPRPAPADPRAEAAKVAEQAKLLVRFLYLYGRISTGLEVADDQAQRGELTPAQQTQMKQNQATLVENLRGVRAGLEKLADEVKTPPHKTWPTTHLGRAADALARAEQQAGAGRYDAAGRLLVSAAERLLDFLVEAR